ncbi:MAG: ERCC4 domain-containing protein [Actinobacteria bacterium]|nr:ERCC4 domain-containing protein [Actinomycetota bacterium]
MLSVKLNQNGGVSPENIFVVAQNPDEESKLPFLLAVPIDGGLVLKARESWPRASRVYCHPLNEGWPSHPEILERVPVKSCRRRGAAIDLVLDRPQLARSQFVFTEVRGRPAIFWQTQKTARTANPGARVPRGRLISGFTIVVDTRERYPFRFPGRAVDTHRAALAAGDYAVGDPVRPIAVVERKTLENFVTCLSDGTLSFQMQRLGEMPLAAVVVEGRYSELFRLQHVDPGWIADVLSRLNARYPEIQVTFADSRKFAEEWTYRFLASAVGDAGPGCFVRMV